MKRPLIYPILTLLLSISLSARAFDPPRTFDSYRITHWTTASGLPQNTVHDLIQSRDGYIWTATPAGLARFDGVRFEVFSRRTTPVLENDRILCVFEDRNGVVWSGTDGGGLCAYSSGAWNKYTTEDGLSDNRVRAITEDLEGNLWVGTDYGLNRLGVEGFRVFTTEDGLYDNIITALDADVRGNLWVGTLMGGVSYYDGRALKTFDIQAGLQNMAVLSLEADSVGTVWIGTMEGLFALNSADGIIRPIPRMGYTPVTGLTIQKEMLWIGTMADGLFMRRNGILAGISSEDGFPDDYIHTLLSDRDGSLWIGTDAAGLIRLEDPQVETITREDGLPEQVISTLLVDRQEDLWVGTRSHGLYRMREGRVVQRLDDETDLAGNQVRVLFEDTEGRIWVGTENGLSRFDQGSAGPLTVREGRFSGRITSIIQDNTGQVWIGTEMGLNRWREGSIDSLGKGEGLNKKGIRVLYLGVDGLLYVGTQSGLYRRVKDRFIELNREPDRSVFDISALFQDADSVLWIGTHGNGLIRWEDDQYTRYTEDHGLFHNSIYSITEDEKGFCWFSSPQGVFKVSKETLEAFARGERDSFNSAFFNEVDGMPSRQCFEGAQPGVVHDQNGKICYPTVMGVAIFNPRATMGGISSPNLVIEKILADNSPLISDELVSIPAGTEKVEIHFTAIDFSAPMKIRFRYRLEGFDTEVREIGPGQPRIVTYNRLKGGEYRFSLNAANNEGIWNEEDLTIRFIVPASPARRTVFRLFVMLVLIGVIVSYGILEYRKRSKRIEKYRTSTLDPERAKKIIPKLRSLIEDEKVYLDPDLTLKDLAQKLRIHSNHLSRIINERFEMGYNDYINKYRIEEAKAKLVDPAESKKGISEIMYETGFYSKSVFNTAFKKITGRTPSEFRRSQSS